MDFAHSVCSPRLLHVFGLENVHPRFWWDEPAGQHRTTSEELAHGPDASGLCEVFHNYGHVWVCLPSLHEVQENPYKGRTLLRLEWKAVRRAVPFLCA